MTHGSEALDLLQELVRLETTSGNLRAQAQAQRLAVDYAQGIAGIRVSGDTRAQRPWTLLETEDAGRTGEAGGLQGSTLFVCHVDAVPVGDLALWENDPFSAELIEGSVYGRGSVDMKGGLVAALYALRQAAQHGASAQVLLTCDEELGCLGASECAEALVGMKQPRLVIVPEATENRISLGHRGATWLRISAHGKAAHGSAPQRGINAIRLLTDHVINKLDMLPLSTDDYLGDETVNLGTIAGGTATNIVPAWAQLTLDVRTVRGGDEVVAWASGLNPCQEGARLEASIERDLPAVHTAELPEALRPYPVAPAATYFTDASALAGVLGSAPVVIWGPGDPHKMHAANERLDLSSWDQAMQDYVDVVLKMPSAS